MYYPLVSMFLGMAQAGQLRAVMKGIAAGAELHSAVDFVFALCRASLPGERHCQFGAARDAASPCYSWQVQSCTGQS